MSTPRPTSDSLAAFRSVVCAIDGSVESVEAAYQGCAIAPSSPVTLVYVLDPIESSSRSSDYPAWVHQSRDTASVMLEETRDKLLKLGVTATIETTVEEGDIVAALEYVSSTKEGPVLLTVGSGEDKETIDSPTPPQTVDGPVARWVVRDVTTSVLVTRCFSEPGRFPGSLVVGVDGSDASLYAYEVAAAIAARSDCAITTVTALGGFGPDLRALEDATPHVAIDRVDPDHPVPALVNAAREDCLIVVGNRGLHGVRSLGSVSASLAAHSPTSVLVVRQV